MRYWMRPIPAATCGPTARIGQPRPRKNWRIGISESCSPTGEAKSMALPNANRKAMRPRSKIRARVEHVFGHQVTAMGGKLVRTIGIARARVKIGMQNLTYNMQQRFTCLERLRGAAT